MKRKINKDHDNTQPRELGADIVKFTSVNGKRDAEVISMCIVDVWVGHMSSKKMVKDHLKETKIKPKYLEV